MTNDNDNNKVKEENLIWWWRWRWRWWWRRRTTYIYHNHNHSHNHYHDFTFILFLGMHIYIYKCKRKLRSWQQLGDTISGGGSAGVEMIPWASASSSSITINYSKQNRYMILLSCSIRHWSCKKKEKESMMLMS